MPSSIEIRDAVPADVDAICDFGAAHIRDHYRPLIGEKAAQAQVDVWWSHERISQTVASGRVAVAEDGGEILGVAEWGEWDARPVVWKLYVHPELRGEGLGPRLLRKVIDQLSPGTKRLQVEHFAGNERAGRFYDRLGFIHLRTEHHASDPALDVVWRELDLGGWER